jgi:hypothetical protein
MIIAENAAKEQAIRDQCAEKVDVVVIAIIIIVTSALF